MKETREQLIAQGHFAGQRERNQKYVSDSMARLAAGTTKNLRFAYEELLRRYLSNGCIALLLGESDEEALRNFRASVDYALKVVGAPASTAGGVRIYEANVELSEQDSRLTSLHEKRPQAGEDKLSITDYHRALICVVCFGNEAQYQIVASVPEEAYRNPGTVAAADHWAYLRAWKALLLGREPEARREAESVRSKWTGDRKTEAGALLAILERDSVRFKDHLLGIVKQYVKSTSKQPNDPVTAVCWPGLVLCRMAISRGIAVEDGPYLPVRLLANHRTAGD